MEHIYDKYTRDCDEQLHNTVADIAKEIDAAVEGRLVRNNKGDLEILDIPLDEWSDKEYERRREEFIKEHPELNDLAEREREYAIDANVCFPEEPEPVTLEDYINDNSLGDIRVEVNLPECQIYGGKILVAWGGPNIWVSCDSVDGYWGTSEAHMSLEPETQQRIIDWINDYAESCGIKERNN